MSMATIGISAAVGAGLTAGKHFAFDKPAADRKRDLAAETTRYSPWTGHFGDMPDEPSLGGSMMQGGMAGASMGAQGKQMEAQNQLMNKLGDKFQSTTPITSTGAVNQPVVPKGSLLGTPPNQGLAARSYYGWNRQGDSPWRLAPEGSYNLYGN